MFTLVKLRRCRSWHGAVTIELNQSYNASLSPFTTEPATFRDILRRTGSVASGSAALWFMLRMPDSWTPADIDILTPRRLLLSNWLGDSSLGITRRQVCLYDYRGRRVWTSRYSMQDVNVL